MGVKCGYGQLMEKKMSNTASGHYSHDFKLDIDKLPVTQIDKISRKIAWCGFVCGILFFILGAFEIISYFMQTSDESYDFSIGSGLTAHQLFVLRYTFDSFILLFGLLIIFLSVVAMRRRKSVYFDGENVKVVYYPLWGKPKVFTDKLYNYLGVLLTVEYYQFGLMNRNRYIIELYHKEGEKRVPLYISTNGDSVRKKWEYYAEKLRMPALFMTDHGLVSRHHNELNKTLREMAKRWNLEALYREDERAPSVLQYKSKRDKVILRERRLFFDVYSILCICGALALGATAVWAVINYAFLLPIIGVWGFMAAMLICLSVAMFAVVCVLSKDVLIITRSEVVLGHNLSILRMDAEFLPKEDIESVDIGHNPVTDRYYLSIISHDNNIVFGKNMPIEDLRWMRGCVIREIVK